MPRQTNFKKEIEQPILSVRGSACKTNPTIVFSYTFTYALASTFTNTPSTHSSFQGTEYAIPTLAVLSLFIALSLHPSFYSDIQLVAVQESLKCLIWHQLHHGISWIILSVDPSNLCNLPSFIGLAKCHDVNHEALLLSHTKLDKAFVEQI
jgi:hypothetical protein